MKVIQMGEKIKCDFRETCYGIVMIGDKLLISYRKDKDEYSLIGGGIEPGETKEDCIKREFLEESGYTVLDQKELVCIDCFWTKSNGRRMETKANFYLVNVSQINVEPLENFHTPRLISKEDALKFIQFPYQIKALEILFFNDID